MKQGSTNPGVRVNITTGDKDSCLVHLEGQLCFAEVPLAYEQTRECIGKYREVRVDLAEVQRSDSAALALILEWHRLAKDAGTNLVLQNMPPMLRNIARVSEIDALLPTMQ